MALPQRVFFTLHEASARWGCSIADIAGWAAIGKLKIMTGIGLVRCGNAVIAGRVTLSAMDLQPLFRRCGTGPVEGVVRRIMPDGSADWLIITDPAGGISVAVADMLILAEDVFGFEDDHDMVRRPSTNGTPYDWEGTPKPTLARSAAFCSLGSFETFTAPIANVCSWRSLTGLSLSATCHRCRVSERCAIVAS